MGKPFEAMRRRSFNPSKFNALLNLAVSRLAVLRNQRGARYNLAQSDVVHILKLGHHERAIMRVEQVIKEQNMLDVFVMMEVYCHLMSERINLIEHEKECPEELKEAVSSMLFASTRCGEFPELQEMRAIFTSRYGKEFVARATELRNNCGVNPKVIKKLSTRQPSLENRLNLLKEIASENGIVLQIEDASFLTIEGKLETKQKQKQQQPKTESSTISGDSKAGGSLHYCPQDMEEMDFFPDSMKAPRKYKDVADAAQAAFKSAAYAAASARAAVELSKSETHDPDQSGSVSGKRKVTDNYDGIESELQTPEEDKLRMMMDENVGMRFGEFHVIENYNSDSENEEIHGEKSVEESEQSKTGLPSLNSDSAEDVTEESTLHVDIVKEIRPVADKGMNSEESCKEIGNEKGRVPLSGNHEFGSEMKPGSPINDEDEVLSEKNGVKLDQSVKKVRVGFRAGLKERLRAWKS